MAMTREQVWSMHNATATHQGLLTGLVAQTTGPVLECGVGHFSTPVLHYMCKHRPLLSLENDKDWHSFFHPQFSNGIHCLYFFKDMEYADVLKQDFCKDLFWDVAFVDHSPCIKRKDTVQALRSRAKYIVVHDAEPQAVAYEWGNLFDTFKYKKYDDFYGNGTMAVSDFAPIEME